MYFIGIIIFLIIGNIILFIGNGLSDLCRWRDAKDNWNPYTQSKSEYWTDHKGKTRYVCNGKIKDGSIETKERVDKREKDRIRFNELSKRRAIREKKTVYDYEPDNNELSSISNGKDNVFFKDLKTGNIYVKRRMSIKGFAIFYYMDIKNGLYVRETDETLTKKEMIYDSKTKKMISSDKTEIREMIMDMCEEHNKTVIQGKYTSNEEYYDFKHCYMVSPSCYLATLEKGERLN